MRLRISENACLVSAGYGWSLRGDQRGRWIVTPTGVRKREAHFGMWNVGDMSAWLIRYGFIQKCQHQSMGSAVQYIAQLPAIAATQNSTDNLLSTSSTVSFGQGRFLLEGSLVPGSSGSVQVALLNPPRDLSCRLPERHRLYGRAFLGWYSRPSFALRDALARTVHDMDMEIPFTQIDDLMLRTARSLFTEFAPISSTAEAVAKEAA